MPKKSKAAKPPFRFRYIPTAARIPEIPHKENHSHSIGQENIRYLTIHRESGSHSDGFLTRILFA